MNIEDRDIKEFLKTISENSDYDFSDYSLNSLRRRIDKALEDFNSDLVSLIEKMRKDSEFMEEVVKQITVNTTELFRDPQVWRKMLLQVLPRFMHLPSINIWHPGCSTGQEVYSMMILLYHMGLLEKSAIYASDINSDVLVAARKGTYRYRFNKEYIDNYKLVFSSPDEEKVKSKKPDWKKYFKVDETKDLIIMKDFLREKPVYDKGDLVKEKNLFNTNFDLIICRNVIIYFNYELQNKVLKMFHTNLKPNGCLLLGMHESIIGPYSNLFTKSEQFYFKKKSPEESTF